MVIRDGWYFSRPSWDWPMVISQYASSLQLQKGTRLVKCRSSWMSLNFVLIAWFYHWVNCFGFPLSKKILPFSGTAGTGAECTRKLVSRISPWWHIFWRSPGLVMAYWQSEILRRQYFDDILPRSICRWVLNIDAWIVARMSVRGCQIVFSNCFICWIHNWNCYVFCKSKTRTQFLVPSIHMFILG